MEPDTLRILYVDDEPVNLRLVQAVIAYVLKRPDEVVTARSGSEGLERLSQEPFDVVLSDQRMPEMSGTRFLALVRERHPDPARVIVTGYADDPEVDVALREGLADAVVAKPWQSRELYQALLDALARRRSDGRPRPPAA